jgi:hypothetical protein
MISTPLRRAESNTGCSVGTPGLYDDQIRVLERRGRVPAHFQLDARLTQPRRIGEGLAALGQHHTRTSSRQQLRRRDPAPSRADNRDAPTDDRERIDAHAITAASALSD